MHIAVSDPVFHQQLARLLAVAPSGEGFWAALTTFLRQSVCFDTWVALQFRTADSPWVLADLDVNQGDSELFAEYRHGLYVLDPFYQFCQEPIDAGLYRLDEVAPACFRETEYFKRYFSLNVVADEVQFLLPISREHVVSLSLGSKRAFTSNELGVLQLFSPWVLSLMRLAARAPEPRQQSAVRRDDLSTRLRSRASGLTERELEVATLMLAGHPTKGIARALSISPDTAKAHRRNLYGKLGINSQAELFLLLYAEA
jgi:DNA-binding CsgD family transcriptional regulator